MNILLIGYRGSGKTTVGRLLAERLDYLFVDTDDAVVERFGGISIKDIFAQHGEPAFREAECDVIDDLLSETRQVIATGGGLPMQPRAQAAIEASDNALCIYLRADAEVLHQRIAGDVATAVNRPNLTGGGLEEVREMLHRREPTYQRLADQTIHCNHLSPPEIVKQIMAELKPTT
jgi:shikimate kinase